MQNIKKTITFSEASKSKVKAFTTLVKPVGSSCNLRCSYCYYIDKSRLYEAPCHIMTDDVLEEYIRQFIESNDVEVVSFCWHGGEPLMAGLDFYKKAVKLQHRYAKGKRIENTLQTNGTLVNEEWCRFFKDNNFLVGLSLDGPSDIHDGYRLMADGRPTFSKVMQAVERFNQYGVEFNTLSVVNNLCEGRGVEVYNFFKSIGSRYMQFLPAVEYITPDGANSRIVSPFEADVNSSLALWSVSSLGYGKFMVDIFDEWLLCCDVGNYFVQLFDVTLGQWYGAPASLCSFAKSCGDGLVVEHNGDVYSCDHFVYPDYKLGNISTDHLRSMYVSSRQFLFGMSKRNGLPDSCTRCRYYFACTGGCPKHRFGGTDTLHGVNYLCEGYKYYFSHVEPYMVKMCSLLNSNRPVSDICKG